MRFMLLNQSMKILSLFKVFKFVKNRWLSLFSIIYLLKLTVK